MEGGSYLSIQHQHPHYACNYDFPRHWPDTEKGKPLSQHRSFHPARWVLPLAQRQRQGKLIELSHSPPPCTPPQHPAGSSHHHTRCPICCHGRLPLCPSRGQSHSPAWHGSDLEWVPLQTPPRRKQSEPLLEKQLLTVLRSK